MEFPQNGGTEGRRQLCIDREHPAAPRYELFAFYRILLRHQDRCVSRKVEIRQAVDVVIREGVRRDIEAELFKMTEEARRISNSRHSVHYAATETLRRGGFAAIGEMVKQAAFQNHRMTILPGHKWLATRAVHHYGIDLTQAPDPFAQRASGKQEAVTDAAFAVEYDNFHIALQAMVLQPVVGDDDIYLRLRGEQTPSSSDTIVSHPDWASAAPRQQDRLVTYFARRRVHGDFARRARATSVPATDDAGPVAVIPQETGQPEHQWSLAAATNGNAPNDDDRDRQTY